MSTDVNDAPLGRLPQLASSAGPARMAAGASERAARAGADLFESTAGAVEQLWRSGLDIASHFAALTSVMFDSGPRCELRSALSKSRLAGWTLKALPLLLSFPFPPSRLLTPAELCARCLGPLVCHCALVSFVGQLINPGPTAHKLAAMNSQLAAICKKSSRSSSFREHLTRPRHFVAPARP
jgi:hypothetical protein